MVDSLLIYIDRLRDGEVDVLEGRCGVDILDVNEKELSFTGEIEYTIEANLAETEVVVRVDADATAVMPCSICNEPCTVPIEVRRVYHDVPPEAFRGGIYNVAPLLREAVLLEVPLTAECGGDCPKRDEVKKFLAQGDEGYQPFRDLKES